jgi:hypothetical protein
MNYTSLVEYETDYNINIWTGTFWKGTMIISIKLISASHPLEIHEIKFCNKIDFNLLNLIKFPQIWTKEDQNRYHHQLNQNPKSNTYFQQAFRSVFFDLHSWKLFWYRAMFILLNKFLLFSINWMKRKWRRIWSLLIKYFKSSYI